MENKSVRKQIIVNYGLITGVVSILITLISYATGNIVKPNILIATISFVLPIVLIVLGIKKYKSLNNGHLTWGQAVKVGIGISLIWGILTLIFQYILETYIDPSIVQQRLEYSIKALQDWGANEEMIKKTIEGQKNQNPLLAKSIGVLGFIFIGFITSAIAGAVMKKDTNDIDFN